MNKKILLLTLLLLIVGSLKAQYGFGTNTPNPNSVMHVYAQDSAKGLVIPIVTTAKRPLAASSLQGMLVYNVTDSCVQFCNGVKWVCLDSISSGGGSVNAWDITGNSGTTAGVNFLGTTDNQDLSIRVNNTEKLLLKTNGTLEFKNTRFSVLIGERAGTYSQVFSSDRNVFIGYNAGYGDPVVGTGDDNIAIGYEAFMNGRNLNNIAIGNYTLRVNTSGGQNNAFGNGALRNNVGGSFNLGLGHEALFSNSSGDANIGVGYHALERNTTGDYNVAIGITALNRNTIGGYSVAVGQGALQNNRGSNAVAIGTRSQYYANDNNGVWTNTNTSVGYGSLQGGSFTASDNTGLDNTAVGYESMRSNITGNQNTAVGYHTLRDKRYGNNNTALGYMAFISNSINLDSNSTAIGSISVITASNQVRIGNTLVTSIGGYANWTNISDARFKTNIKEDIPGLDFIKKLRPVTYNLDVNKINSFLKIPDSLIQEKSCELVSKEIKSGFIAQEVEEAAKSLGYDFSGVDAPKNENDHYGLRYAEFVVPLVKAVQEQQEIIEELKKENEELKKDISEIKETLKR